MVFPVELLASVVIIFVVTRFGSLLDVVHRPFRNIKCGMVLSAAGQYHLVPFPTRPRSLLAHPFFEAAAKQVLRADTAAIIETHIHERPPTKPGEPGDRT